MWNFQFFTGIKVEKGGWLDFLVRCYASRAADVCSDYRISGVSDFTAPINRCIQTSGAMKQYFTTPIDVGICVNAWEIQNVKLAWTIDGVFGVCGISGRLYVGTAARIQLQAFTCKLYVGISTAVVIRNKWIGGNRVFTVRFNAAIQIKAIVARSVNTNAIIATITPAVIKTMIEMAIIDIRFTGVRLV